MTTNGLNIKPQMPPLPVQLGTMLRFVRSESVSELSHAWGGVQARVWGHVRELDRYDVCFPEPGSNLSAYADFRNSVISRGRHYMDRRIDMAYLELEKYDNFAKIGVDDPLAFAELLVEAKGYGIVSGIIADVMLAKAGDVFEGRGIDVASSEIVSVALAAVRKERFERETKSKDTRLRPMRRKVSTLTKRGWPRVGRRALGTVAGLGGVASTAIGAYMLSVAAPGIIFLMLGMAGVVYGISTFVSNPRRQG